MKDLIFTRLLYPYFDVIQSLYETFKTKSSYDECLFWMSEIYFSMFYDDAFFIIYFIYFSFNVQYDTENKLYNSIQENHKKWRNSSTTKLQKDKSPTHSHFFKLFTKLYNSKYNKEYSNILLVHENSSESHKLIIYRGIKPDFMNKYTKDLHNIIYSLHKENTTNVWNYIEKYYEKQNINKMLSAYELLLNELSMYISSEVNNHYNKENNILLKYKNLFQYFKSDNIPRHYYTSISKLITLNIIQTSKQNNKFNKFIKAKDVSNTCNYLQYFNYNDEYIKILNKPNYRLLKILRKYTLKLDKERSMEDTIDLRRNYYYHWTDYLSLCPLWKERLLFHNVIIDYTNNTLLFPDTDTEELFYDHYNYEPDEQEIGITNMLLI